MQYEELQLKILEWKEMYEEVYQVNLIDKDKENVFSFIFHTLGREEYKSLIRDDVDEVQFQEIICYHAVLYPDDYDFSNGLAGIPEILSDIIIETSGLHLGQAKQILDHFREQMMIYDYQADCIIHEAFPEFTIEEIQSWSNKKTMYYLSRAEWILINLKGVPLVPLDQQVTKDMQSLQEQYQYNFQNDQPPQISPQPEVYPEFQEPFEEDFEDTWMPSDMPVQESSKKQPQGGVQSEAELLAILGQSEAKQGRSINKPSNGTNEMFPELNWFRHEEELKGDFD